MNRSGRRAEMELPTFRYFPDPVGQGVIKRSDKVCIVCEQARGYIYTCHAYARKEYIECICPWCIADGSAHRKLNVSFNDLIGDEWQNVPQAIVDEITFRTPGFFGWQQERWFAHCDDGAAFLGRMGYAELKQRGKAAVNAIRDSTGLLDDDAWEDFFEVLDKDGAPTAYLFRCPHCGEYLGYTDTD